MMQPGGNMIGFEGKRRQGKNESQKQTLRESVTGRLTADTDPPVAAE